MFSRRGISSNDGRNRSGASCLFRVFRALLLFSLMVQIHAFHGVAHAANVALEWDAPSDPSLIAGYRIYYGLNSGAYDSSMDVGEVTTYVVDGLKTGSTYYFAVIAYDASGNESDFSNEVSYAANAEDAAEFSSAVVDADDQLSVAFTNLSSGDITSITWDFGDGTTSNEESPSHTYAMAGEYTVTLTVVTSEGEYVMTRTIQVWVAAFDYAPVNKVVSLTINFDNLSSGDFTGWKWDFGDGGSSTEDSPSHAYAAAGEYTVTLTASSAEGDYVSTKTVTVNEPGPNPVPIITMLLLDE
jgi:PKD repeat protein